MASMNKPAAQDSNWYRAVTENWKSIETNLIDKTILTAKGDIFVSAGTGTPLRLGVGSNEQLLTADSGSPGGVKWAGSIGLPDTDYLNDIVYDTRFFSQAGLLPGTKYYETPADTAPVVGWDNTGIASVAVGTSRRWQGVAATQLVGWDLGDNRQRILMILTGFQNCGGDRLVLMSKIKPSSGDMVGNGYAGGINAFLGSGIYKVTSGSYSNLSATTFYPYCNFAYSVAMLFDNGNVRYFYRFGSADWVEGTFKNDGTYTTLRHCGVRIYGGGSLTLGPVAIYYDT